MEAYYDLIFLGIAYVVFHRRYTELLALLALLSWSHPFTGIQALAVVLSWLVLETYLENQARLKRFVAPVVGLMLLHVVYYLWFLNLDAEHHELSRQWSLDWSYKAENFVPAYALVVAMAAWQLRTPQRLQQVLGVPFYRFLAVWAVVSFVLANHEFAGAPVQPLHFTRGYVWTPLFLLGAISLTDLLDRAIGHGRSVLGGLTVLAVCGLFVFDNGAWFVAKTLRQRSAQDGYHLSAGQAEVLKTLEAVGSNQTLVVSQDRIVGHLAVVYTQNRSWVSHWFNTPFREDKVRALDAFFAGGPMPEAWTGRRLLVVEAAENKPRLEGLPRVETVLDRDAYRVTLRP